MKRNTLIKVVLCLMMITTAEVGAKSSRHEENPRQAGKSSIYFYDVESKEGSGYGRLVINADKKTFTFIGQDFLPSQHVYIKVDTDGQLHLAADGKSTKSGNLHIQGEWEGAPPKPGTVGASYIYGPAYGFTLDNLGGYVAHIKVQWSTDNGATWHTTSNQSKDVSLLEIYFQNIKDLDPNIPIGSLVRMKMDVVWGDDVVADEIFKYVDTPGMCYPYYQASGAVWNASLSSPFYIDCQYGGTWCIFGFGEGCYFPY
jgi:hypothetical protein